MKKGVFFLLLVLLSGCVSVGERDARIVGDPVRLDVGDLRADVRPDGRFFLSGHSVRLSDVVRVLAGFGVRLAYDERLSDKSVSLDLDGDYSILEVMRILEVRFSCRAVKNGDLWVLTSSDDGGGSSSSASVGSLRDPSGGSSSGGSDEGYVYYIRLPAFSYTEVMERLADYSVRRLGNGLYYCRLNIGRVMQLDDMVRKMVCSMPCQYLFTVWFVSDDVVRDLGVSVTPELRGSVGKSFSRGAVLPYTYNVVFDAVFNSSFELSKKRGVRRMGGVVREGAEFSFRIGDEVPMAKRTVSDQGTVTDTGYDYQNFGFSVRVSVEGRSYGVCKVELENNDIGGYVNGMPIRHGSNLNTVLSIGDNSRLYVGSCLMDSDVRGFFSFRRQVQMYHVWLQCDLLEVGQRAEPIYDFK